MLNLITSKCSPYSAVDYFVWVLRCRQPKNEEFVQVLELTFKPPWRHQTVLTASSFSKHCCTYIGDMSTGRDERRNDWRLLWQLSSAGQYSVTARSVSQLSSASPRRQSQQPITVIRRHRLPTSTAAAAAAAQDTKHCSTAASFVLRCHWMTDCWWTVVYRWVRACFFTAIYIL